MECRVQQWRSFIPIEVEGLPTAARTLLVIAFGLRFVCVGAGVVRIRPIRQFRLYRQNDPMTTSTILLSAPTFTWETGCCRVKVDET